MSERESKKLNKSVHRFGGQWTLSKLEALQKYLSAYTNALKNKSFRLHYIDAFAGSGAFEIMVDGESVSQRGSAQIALDTTPQFHELIFIEKDGNRCDDLRALSAERPDRSVRVIQGDANIELANLCASIRWSSNRAVLFLDPYGAEVEWATLGAIARTKAIDVWYLFPLSGLYRQMAKDSRQIDPGKEATITRLLGTDQWKEAMYSQPPTKDLFGDDHDQRHTDVEQITQFVTERIGSLFPMIAGPKVLHLTLPGRQGVGAPMYALYFAASNPSPGAAGLACRIAKDVLNSL